MRDALRRAEDIEASLTAKPAAPECVAPLVAQLEWGAAKARGLVPVLEKRRAAKFPAGSAPPSTGPRDLLTALPRNDWMSPEDVRGALEAGEVELRVTSPDALSPGQVTELSEHVHLVCGAGFEEGYVRDVIGRAEKLVVLRSGALVLGFAAVRRAASPRDYDEVELLCANPCNGIGTLLMDVVERQAAEAGRESVVLEALNRDVAVFYEKRGYRRSGAGDWRSLSQAVRMTKGVAGQLVAPVAKPVMLRDVGRSSAALDLLRR